jgi:hypothetical protein
MMPLTSHAEMIDEERQESIDRIITSLHDLLGAFLEGRNSCSFECSSILLGALTKEMHARHYLSPRPAMPFLGFSFATIARGVRGIRSPTWCSHRSGDYYSSYCSPHACSLEARIHPIISNLEDSMKGLALADLPLPEDEGR